MTKTETLQFKIFTKKIKFTYCILDIYLISFLLIIWSLSNGDMQKRLLNEIANSKTIYSENLNFKEEQIKQLVKEFENEAYFRGVTIDASYITFNIKNDLNQYLKIASNNVDSDYTVLGVCHSLGHINYQDSLFKEESKFQLRLVVFHELGHCLWGLDHKGKETMDIMSENAYDWDKAFLDPNGRVLWNNQVDLFFNEIKRNKQTTGVIFRLNQQMAKLKYQTYWKIKNL